MFLRRALLAPFGYALRAGRDSPLRADAIGINVFNVQWMAFVLAGLVCGVAGALFAFSKGTIAPDVIQVSRSIDGLVMVLLGGVQTMAGPVVGAALFTWLQDLLARDFQYWHAALGVAILVLVLIFPLGVAGSAQRLFARFISRNAAPVNEAGA
jgi:branched-chain amino acid transport system permease protein